MRTTVHDQEKGDPALFGHTTICSVCAWRKDCLKKYFFSPNGPVNCADFTRDLSLAEDETGTT